MLDRVTLVVGLALVWGCTAIAGLDNEYNLASSSVTGMGSVAAGTGGGGPDAKCIPSMNADPVGDDCGVFVELGGDDTNDGTKGKPLKSLAAAVERAKGGVGNIYACGQVFLEAMELPAEVSLFGGLDCMGGWKYGTTRTTIVAPADMVPLRVMKGAEAMRVEDVNARAADATLPGGSSIAVIVDGSPVDFARCDFTAANGAAGEKGATPQDNVGPLDNIDDASITGAAGTNACMGDPATGTSGGVGKTNDLCIESAGGNGGSGAIAAMDGASGTDGAPASASGKGKAGAGDTGPGCEPGGYGQDGAAGAPGAGATTVGTIFSTGFVGASGSPGGRGSVGQGGGGGGGGRGKVGCNGPSGGGGGAGGCGGFGGLGGSAGGASIALISLDATLTFTDVTFVAGSGGAGGDGGDGQIGGIGGAGGKGGIPAAGTTKGCVGGDGGFGGTGGQGGGGRGGHSLGIAFTGKAPAPPTKVTVGTAGMGGLGADMAGNGLPGEAKEILEMPAAVP